MIIKVSFIHYMTLDNPRITCAYNIAKTKTFRLGSRKLCIRIGRGKENYVGTNLQNQERTVKSIYVSDGWKLEDKDEKAKLADYLVRRDISIFTDEQRSRIKIFVKPDQSGAEAVIVAYLCRNGNYRELVRQGIKIHVFVGLHVFADVWKKELESSGTGDLKVDIDALCNSDISSLRQYPYWKKVDKLIKDSDKWSNDKRYYFIAKQIAHSSNYGVGDSMFQLNTLQKSRGKIVIARHDAQKYLNIYHSIFPEIHAWHREVSDILAQTKTLFNLFGYPRLFWFPEKYPNDTLLKEALAYVPQSTVGTITNIAFTKMYEHIVEHKLDWALMGNEHDSYMSQCPVGEEIECGARMKEFICANLTAPDGSKFQMGSEVKVGLNWGDNSESNPLGLVEL